MEPLPCSSTERELLEEERELEEAMWASDEVSGGE